MGGNSRPNRDGKVWSREESVLAFDLYCRIPFSKTKANNPLVIALARILQRTPASVARKLGNFGAFDPELKKRQITGLTHTSKLDKEIWDEFNNDWGRLVLEAENIRQQKGNGKSFAQRGEIIKEVTGPTEREARIKQRIHQDFFRASVLAGYNQKCCICGLPHQEILIASHIVPWSVREDTRVNPSNGLCLCASHDRAYDQSLIVINADFRILLGKKLKKSTDTASQFMFTGYEGKYITLPERFVPKAEFLKWRLERFLGNQNE